MWKGQYCGQEVAVQVLRVYRQSDYERIRRVSYQQSTQPTVHTNSCISQRFCKEVVTWKALHHPNVMPLLGVTMTETQFMMASEWVDNGNINEFVKADANVDRLELVCYFPKLSLCLPLMVTQSLQLRGVTKGLMYMHGQGIVHGDLKGVCIFESCNCPMRLTKSQGKCPDQQQRPCLFNRIQSVDNI